MKITIDIEPKEIADLAKELQDQQKTKNDPRIQKIVENQLKALEKASKYDYDKDSNIALAFAALLPYC
ncbi:MAG: hypothetical protein NC299_16735 [Lachnospiraceae bacterium]|nr:hypothetical protein [Lachnospiraceae bacterium]